MSSRGNSSSSPSAPPIAPKSPKRKYIRKERRVLADAGIPARRGSLRTSEKSTIDKIIAPIEGEIVPAQINAIAVAMQREPATIERYIRAARERFLSNADRYAQIHMAAAEAGLVSNDPKGLETARKASEFAMQNAGTKESRVIESPGQSSNAPVIKIGIALGGLPSKQSDSE